jgi:precorrin-6A/cobalt-precorrin-6A reductase
MNRTILILGGTTEARALAAALAGQPAETGDPASDPTGERPKVITSLAGRTSSPLVPAGELRIGGFGGVEGLAAYLRERGVDAVVDATHPFAAGMSGNAAAAAASTGVPLLALRRPGWVEGPGDDWHRVPSVAGAAALLPGLGRRVFLTTGRQEIGAFAALDDCWFLARSVEPPAPPMPKNLEVVLDRGPFTVDGELQLIRTHRLEVLVSKNSGGADAKLTAARETRTPVVLIDRPPSPPGIPTATTVSDAVTWLRTTR